MVVVPKVGKAEAKQALETILAKDTSFRNFGDGTGEYFAAKLILQTLVHLAQGLDNPQRAKNYLTPLAAEVLPASVISVASYYCKGLLSKEEAEEMLNGGIKNYAAAFQALGIGVCELDAFQGCVPPVFFPGRRVLQL